MRSDLLVHWTGGTDISAGVTDPVSLTAGQATQYVDRLASILSTGLRFTKPKELIYGAGNAFVGFQAPTTCFTEVRLSQALRHAQKYGYLGVVVERRFVLDRFGGPVHYLRNHFNEKFVDCYSRVGKHVQDQTTGTQRVFDALSYCASFLKAMSTRDSDDFEQLNEHEWRIVFVPELLHAGTAKEVQPGQYSVALAPADVKLVIFPNANIRTLWLSHSEHARLAAGQSFPPVYLTLKECTQF